MTQNQQFLNQITQAIQSCATTKELTALLKGLLTPPEIEMIATRIKIVSKLKHSIPQRIIAEELGVGIATVTRGARELKNGYFASII